MGLSGLVIAALCGCGDTETPNEFKVRSGSELYSIVRQSCGPIKRKANDKDYDGDGRNDFYVEAEDGTIFATHSSDYPPKELSNLFCPKFYKHNKEK